MSIAISGSSITFADQTQMSTASGGSFRNRIINGDMRIDQRNAGAATANTINGSVVDRFQVAQSTSGKLIAQRNAGSVTPPSGFTNYLGVTSQSSYSVSVSEFFLVQHALEGLNVSDLAWGTASAKTVTVSFWVRSSLTGTFGGSLRNSGNNRSYPFSYSISSANTWEQKTITVSGDTTGTWETGNGTGIWLALGLGVGSTNSGTAGAWAGGFFLSTTGATSVVGTNAATFYITGVQLEVGSNATDFERRPIGTELALCQRYFEKSYALDVPPASVNYLGAYFGRPVSDIYHTVGFRVEKRANPAVTLYSPQTGTANRIYRIEGAADITGSAAQIATTGFHAINSVNISGVLYNFHWVAVAEL